MVVTPKSITTTRLTKTSHLISVDSSHARLIERLRGKTLSYYSGGRQRPSIASAGLVTFLALLLVVVAVNRVFGVANRLLNIADKFYLVGTPA